jgi:hypothetical protein
MQQIGMKMPGFASVNCNWHNQRLPNVQFAPNRAWAAELLRNPPKGFFSLAEAMIYADLRRAFAI